MTKVLSHCAKERRIKRTRKRIARLNVISMHVHRTPQHIYVQVKDPETANVLASASSLEKTIREARTSYKGKIAVAEAVGKLVAERALKAGVKKIAFDRSGFRYHGRVKALADGARASGLEF